MSDLFILSLPTAFAGLVMKKVSDLFILLLPTAFDAAGRFFFLLPPSFFKLEKKVSDLFILLLPTAFDVVGSFFFYVI